MRPRIKYKEKVMPSTTTVEATTYWKKVEHLQKVINKKCMSMGISPVAVV
jgi:hypothetical protein